MAQQIKRSRAFIYTALPCEAKPLVSFFGLKKNVGIQPFAVYFNDSLCLTVTGPGKSAMAAGVAYSQALFAVFDYPVQLNIGIAGHKDYELGKLFLIDKITDKDSGRNYYPPLVFTPPCATACIETVSVPQLSYDRQALCDMEASAFYEIATRFSTSELVHCLKVISDNQSSPAENIQAKQVAELIAANVTGIETVLAKLTGLAESISVSENKLFKQLLQHYRFTSSEQGQLKNRLSRWTLLDPAQTADVDLTAFRQGKDVLLWLERQIDQIEFYL